MINESSKVNLANTPRLIFTGLAIIAAFFLAYELNAQDASTDAENPQFKAGVHYEELQFPVRTNDKNKIEVAEFFSYACIHCYNFEPSIKSWLSKNQSNDIDFQRTPAIFNETWKILAQAYYTAEALGVLDRTHQAIFDSIHQGKRQFANVADLAVFFEEQGVNRQEFEKMFNSYAIRTKVRQADARGRGYRANAVPTMIVNGRYRIDASQAGGQSEMLEIVDFLVQKERAKRELAQTK